MHRPRGLALIGLLTVLDGAWGAIVPFVGPLLGYRSHGQGAWEWSSLHGVLYLAPGAVAVLFGLIILARARSVTRGSVGFAGLVVAACGAWFVVGPALWPTFGTGPVFTPAATAMDNFVHQVGYNLGVGVILAILGGMALKALARDRVVAVDEREPYDVRARLEPTRREPMTPGSAPGVDRRAREERVATGEPAAWDRGPGDTRVGVGNGTTYQRPEGEWAHREGGGIPAEGVREDERVRREGGGVSASVGGVRAEGARRDRVPADQVPADEVPAEGGGERRGLRGRFSR